VAKEKRGLGRGLEALIPSAGEQERPVGGPAEVPVSAISPNPRQPRHRQDPETLRELADSIREHGLIQPLIVTQAQGSLPGAPRYQLIAGERRWQAAKIAGLPRVPVIVKEATPQQSLELALVENIQRADLNALEEAQAYQQLVEEFGLTQEQVAGRVGKSRVAVTNTLRLLRLPDEAKAALLSGHITEGHARAILALESEDLQAQALRLVMRLGLNVRQTEELTRKLLSPPPEKEPTPPPSPETKALQSRLETALNTRVHLERGKKGGRLVIHFYSEEELESLCDVLLRE
jgi:ParB family chromosome partitioning protein